MATRRDLLKLAVVPFLPQSKPERFLGIKAVDISTGAMTTEKCSSDVAAEAMAAGHYDYRYGSVQAGSHIKVHVDGVDVALQCVGANESQGFAVVTATKDGLFMSPRYPASHPLSYEQGLREGRELYKYPGSMTIREVLRGDVKIMIEKAA